MSTRIVIISYILTLICLIWLGKPKKLTRKLHFILTVIFFIITFTLGVIIIANKNIEFLAEYSKPICKYDLHTFTSEVCSECNEVITESGCFRSLTKDSTVPFISRYKQYADYKRDLNAMRILTGSFLFIVTLSVYLLTTLIFDRSDKEVKKSEKRHKKKKGKSEKK